MKAHSHSSTHTNITLTLNIDSQSVSNVKVKCIDCSHLVNRSVPGSTEIANSNKNVLFIVFQLDFDVITTHPVARHSVSTTKYAAIEQCVREISECVYYHIVCHNMLHCAVANIDDRYAVIAQGRGANRN